MVPADQQTDGARTIAESSANLSDGAQNQAASVEQMTAAVEEMTAAIKVKLHFDLGLLGFTAYFCFSWHPISFLIY